LDGDPQSRNPWGDTPGQTLLPGQNLFFEIYATTWLMVETAGSKDTWVPVASIDWNWTLNATYPNVANSTINVIATRRAPVVATSFTATAVFPKWTGIAGEVFVSVENPLPPFPTA
jgi:hypothetical protein